MKREYRVFRAAEIRASNEGRRITGHAAVFDQLSEDLGGFREIVKRGAFSRCLKDGADVRCLFNHDSSQVLGRRKAGTLRIAEDSTGLGFDCDPPDTQAGHDVLQLVHRGDIDQCSFGFTVREQNWREEMGPGGMMETTRELVDVDLFDISPVTYAAYPQTSVSARALWPDGEPSDILEHRKDKKTKRVDGEELTGNPYAQIVRNKLGNPTDGILGLSPVMQAKQSIGLALFGQVQGLSEEEKNAAWAKFVRLCKEHNIDVSEKDSLRYKREMIERLIPRKPWQ
jgi:HK97 family phage prohead protease